MDLHLRTRRFSGDFVPVFTRSETNPNQIEFSKFDASFDFKSVSQEPESLFETVGKPILDDRLFKGQDCLLFTLGPSNSGKTHTVFDPETGLAVNSLRYVFERLSQYGDISTNHKKLAGLMSNLWNGNTSQQGFVDSEYAVTLSMFEIYNDNIKDLLMNTTTKKSNSFLDIITDPVDQKLKPYNLSQFMVSDFENAIRTLNRGLSNRKTCTTHVNRDSSRSHCFLFINVVRISGRSVNCSRLTLADLAGLERSKLSMTSGLNLREGSFTNASLTQLGRCLELVATKQFNKSLLRTNKLTRLIFHDYVKSKSLISIIVNLDPAGDEGLILQTLRYVNPIQYQKVPRHTSSSCSQIKTVVDSKTQHELLCQLDTLKLYQQKLETKVARLEEEVVQTEVRIRQELYEENEAKLNQIAVEHKNEIFQLNQEHELETDSKLKELSQCYQDKLNREVSLKNEELEKSKAFVEELKNKCEQLKQLNELLETQINELKEQHEQTLKDAQQELQVSLQKSDDLGKMVEEAEEQNRKIESELTLKVSEINELRENITKLQQGLSSNSVEFDLKAKKLEEEYQAKLKAELEARERDIQSLKDLMQENSNDLTTEHEKIIKTLKSQHDQAVESFKEQHRVELESLKDEHEKQMAPLRERIESLVKELETNNVMMAEFQKTHDKQISEMNHSTEEMAKEIESKEREIEDLKNKLVQVETKSKNDIRNLRSQLESMKTKMSVLDSVDRAKTPSRSPAKSPTKSPYLFPTDLYTTNMNMPISIFEDHSPQRESAVRKSPGRKKKSKKTDKGEQVQSQGQSQKDVLKPTNKLVETEPLRKHSLSPTKSNRKKLRRVDLEEDLAISE
ncbi:hypothetical protein KL928_002831 [Ogataea angusta]|uniref:Kinesin motor domain-containing protein n=1 Tax=Pichia angusta TaxID=870730 RepID=A0AAN6DFL8_PICAN|nr:uncharacterized protein KL928_002831 [Ogataea angusta]KAG7818963.1 hypothetical protein KL928_002831 [Ogataea angusta]KAG7834472.1 hypothetical protein KL943_002856 [Ogataea angusta]